MTGRPHVAVIGGGITGLTAARALGRDVDVTVYEQQERWGGKIATASFRHRPVDTGADAFITRNPAGESLCKALGLGHLLISPSATSVAIFSRGGLRALPSGLNIGIPTDLGSLYRSGVVSRLGCLRALGDRIAFRNVAPERYRSLAGNGTFDPSVGALVGGRLGHEVLSVLVDPLIGGINASEASGLSFAAALPQLVDKVSGQKSLMKALALPAPPQSAHGATPSARPSPFRGLVGGMSVLVEQLAQDCARAGTTISTNSAVTSLTFSQGTWTLNTQAGERQAHAVVIALPSFVASELLAKVAPELSGELGAIPYAGVATVTMAWPREVVEHLKGLEPPRSVAQGPPSLSDLFAGSGVLVPRQFAMHITAASFTSTKWPQSANDGEIVIRSSLGRFGDTRWNGLSDDELIATVRRELDQLIGVQTEPLEVLVRRFPNALAQYVPGHLARVARIDQLSNELRTLALAGASYHGIGIPACVHSGQEAATAVLRQLES